jgi:hypothetical protein
LSALPIAEYAVAGQPLEVRVPWWPETLWFVPDQRHAAALAPGIAPARIWTARELSLLVAGRVTNLQYVMTARQVLSAEVVECRPLRATSASSRW